MQKLLVVGSVALIAGGALAQNPLSNFLNQGVSFTTRCAANLVAASIWTRIDNGLIAGWGVDPANPGMRSFTGLHFFIQDQDASTADQFSLTVFGESIVTPDTPDTSSTLATTGLFTLPTGAAGPAAYNATANFATPVLAPATADVFVAVSTPIGWNAATPTDGLSIWATSAVTTFAVHDGFGGAAPAASPGNTFSGSWTPSTSTLVISPTRECMIEPITVSPSGTATALHYSDTAMAVADTVPGTASFISAFYPDDRNPPVTAGRADDIGMVFNQANIPDGTIVFFLAEITTAFGPEIPVSTLLPGSVGVTCLDLGNITTTGFSLTAAGTAFQVITIPAAARTFIAGLPIAQQAVAIDLVNSVAYAGPCSLQTL